MFDWHEKLNFQEQNFLRTFFVIWDLLDKAHPMHLICDMKGNNNHSILERCLNDGEMKCIKVGTISLS